MADDNAKAAAGRRQGRNLAFEGLLATQFGKRASKAGQRALARLTAAQSPSAPEVVADRPPSPALITRLTPAEMGVPETRLEAQRQRQWVWLAMAASLALLIGGLLFRLGMNWEPVQAMLEVKSPDVILMRNGQRLNATAGFRLKAGDRIITPKGATATIHYRQDASVVQLAERTEIRCGDIRTGKHLKLVRGTLEARVVPQLLEHPMVIVTPQAEATVTGTHFTLAARQTSTWLEVANGEVQFKRLEDKATTAVGSQEYSVAARGLALAAYPGNQRWQTPYNVSNSRPQILPLKKG